MQIYLAGIQDISSIDYPEHVCSVIFFQGCNLRCKFCYNSNELGFKKKSPLDEVFKQIAKNLQVIDSIMLSGGEALIHEDAILKIKEWCDEHNLLLGIETNGTFPTRLKRLMEDNTFDFIAMDIKSLFDENEYGKITNNKKMYSQFLKSFKLLKKSKVPHEFRMTVTPSLHSIEDILNINKVVMPSKLILQRFQIGENVLDKRLNDEVFPQYFVKKLTSWAKSQKNVEMRFWD